MSGLRRPAIGAAKRSAVDHEPTDSRITEPAHRRLPALPPPANRPTPEERDACLPYLAAELRLLHRVRMLLCLGSFAWDGALRVMRTLGHMPERRPVFGHGALATVGPYALVGSYHPSQQN